MEQMTSTDSLATAACGWDDVFWQEVGLGDLVEGNYAKIGRVYFFLIITRLHMSSRTRTWAGFKCNVVL